MVKVAVKWLDSGTFIDGWKDLTDIAHSGRLHYVTTVGTLVHEDDEALYIGLSLDDEERGVYGVQVISRASVKHVHHLAFMSDETEKYQRTTS